MFVRRDGNRLFTIHCDAGILEDGGNSAIKSVELNSRAQIAVTTDANSVERAIKKRRTKQMLSDYLRTLTAKVATAMASSLRRCQAGYEWLKFTFAKNHTDNEPLKGSADNSTNKADEHTTAS